MQEQLADAGWTEVYALACMIENVREEAGHPKAVALETKDGELEPDPTLNWQPVKFA